MRCLQVFWKIYDKLLENMSGIFSKRGLYLMTLACTVIEKRNPSMPTTIVSTFTKKLGHKVYGVLEPAATLDHRIIWTLLIKRWI